MELINYGESALLINFEQVVDLEVNRNVVNLFQYLELDKPLGYQYAIPAYCSLTVVFDPLVTSHMELGEHILGIEFNKRKKQKQRKLSIPVCYDQEMGLDTIDLSKTLGLSPAEIISIHANQQYHIYMIGFLPGFPYMGSLDKKLETKRKATPRLKVPERSIAIAGIQTGIYPIESPGGWNIIGRTPIPIFDPSQNNPFLFMQGDQVRFEPITIEAYAQLEEEIDQDRFDYQSLIYVD